MVQPNQLTDRFHSNKSQSTAKPNEINESNQLIESIENETNGQRQRVT